MSLYCSFMCLKENHTQKPQQLLFNSCNLTHTRILSISHKHTHIYTHRLALGITFCQISSTSRICLSLGLMSWAINYLALLQLLVIWWEHSWLGKEHTTRTHTRMGKQAHTRLHGHAHVKKTHTRITPHVHILYTDGSPFRQLHRELPHRWAAREMRAGSSSFWRK